MRVYISGPLGASPDLLAARELYEKVASTALDAGLQPYLPHMHTDPERAGHIEAADVYRHDLAALNTADVIVAHVGIPSTGVGAELALAAGAGMTIVGIARAEEAVSRFAAGLITENGGHLLRFDDDTDLRAQLHGHLAAVVQSRRDRLAS